MTQCKFGRSRLLGTRKLSRLPGPMNVQVPSSFRVSSVLRAQTAFTRSESSLAYIARNRAEPNFKSRELIQLEAAALGGKMAAADGVRQAIGTSMRHQSVMCPLARLFFRILKLPRIERFTVPRHPAGCASFREKKCEGSQRTNEMLCSPSQASLLDFPQSVERERHEQKTEQSLKQDHSIWSYEDCQKALQFLKTS